jgi:hypothetical protein
MSGASQGNYRGLEPVRTIGRMDFWIDELLDYRRLQIACSLIHQSTNPIIRQGGHVSI